jgi:cobaltochelatase CobN
MVTCPPWWWAKWTTDTRWWTGSKGESLDAQTDAVCDASPEIEPEKMKSRIAACGKNELTSLMKTLNGGYVASGEGNDPVRNPEAIPTGRHFHRAAAPDR